MEEEKEMEEVNEEEQIRTRRIETAQEKKEKQINHEHQGKIEKRRILRLTCLSLEWIIPALVYHELLYFKLVHLLYRQTTIGTTHHVLWACVARGNI